MPDDDTALAQGTVDARNEERRPVVTNVIEALASGASFVTTGEALHDDVVAFERRYGPLVVDE